MEDNINNIPVIETQENNVPPTEEAKPVEQYSFTFTRKDGYTFYSEYVKKMIIRTVIISLVILFIACGNMNMHVNINDNYTIFSAAPFFFGILFVYLVIKAAIIAKTVNTCKKSTEYLDGSLYEYSFYPTYIKIRRSKNDEPSETDKFDLRDITKIERKENYIRILAGNRFILLKENEIPPESPFLYYINTSPLTKSSQVKSKYHFPATVLFVLSLLSVFFAMAAFILISGFSGSPDIGDIWVFFLFTPIPLASLCFGLFAKKKGYSFKKNIVAGIIIFGLLCAYGSFAFVFKDITTESPELYLETEELTGIDLPEYTSIRTQDWTTGSQNISRGYIFETSTAEITNAVSEAFRLKILKDDRWLKKIPTILIGITSDYCTHPYYEYALIYNVDTGEYNTLPEESGTYRFINIVFSAERDSLMVVDYEIEYTK